MRRTIIIGDIHGCYAELMDLLDKIGPTADDRIIALGDVVDRGPDSEKVLEFLRDTPNAISIMGNHERKHIRSARGEVRAALSQQIVRQQMAERYPEWLAFMEQFPRHMELPEAILVHGFFEPGIPLEDQLDTVVIGTLTGEKRMLDHYPEPWYGQYSGPKPLIVGHHSYLRSGEPVIREGLFYGIDTGVAHGLRLTALVLPEFQVVSVPARADHWTEQQARYAIMAGSGKDDLDLDWETLQVYAQSAGNKDLPPRHAERAKRCANILATVQQVVAQVHAAVGDLSRVILADLATADDWKALAPKKQASRYALRVQEQPRLLAPLLHKARQDRLDEGMVYKAAKTPRMLGQLCEEVSSMPGIELQGTEHHQLMPGTQGNQSDVD